MISYKNCICGIEIGKNLITAAQYFPKENAIGSIVVKPFDAANEGDDDERLKKEFKKLILDIELKNQKIVLSLPSEFATIKKITLDNDESDIEEAILWELSQHLIGTIEEYSFDFEPLPVDREGEKRFLAVAYRKSSIQNLVSMLKANKLDPFIVDLDCFALVNVFEANYSELLPSLSALVIGNEEKSKIVLSRNGTLVNFDVMSHSAAVSPDDYAMQLNDFLATSGTTIGAPSGIYCSGSLFLQTDFIDALERKFGKAEVLNPFKNIICHAAKEESNIAQFASQLAVAVGLALRGKTE
jgi:Tfp pilus assembly PilM family ATPase